MYLLYLDESGQHGGGYFVLAGAAIFERQVYWVGGQVDKLQSQYLPGETSKVEFHATEIRAGRTAPWDRLDQKTRFALLDEVYDRIAASDLVLFGVAIERAWLKPGDDAYAFAFESLVSRFDSFLRRKYQEQDEPQRGIVIIAHSEYTRRIETIALKMREAGTRWGDLTNLPEIPLFTQAANSRLLQVADFCANAIHGRYEGGYGRAFDKIVRLFDQCEGQLCGLGHFSRDFSYCCCPACLSRRIAGARGVQEPGLGGPA